MPGVRASKPIRPYCLPGTWHLAPDTSPQGPDRTRGLQKDGTARHASRSCPSRAKLPTSPRPPAHIPSRKDKSGTLAGAGEISRAGRRELESTWLASLDFGLLGRCGRRLRRKQSQHFLFQGPEGNSPRRLTRVQHDVPALREALAVQTEQFTQTPFDAVAEDRSAHASGNGNPQARLRKAVGPVENRESGPVAALALVVNSPKLCAFEQPGALGKSPPGWRGIHAERIARPFWRRLFKTRRPPEVFIRLRNPCVFERRRRLG